VPAVSLSPYETVGLIVGLGVIVAALVITAHLRPPSMVIMAVSILTLALLAAWLAAPDRADNLIPLVGVGLGALAGAVTNIFDRKDKDDDGSSLPPPSGPPVGD
jgi:ABC-type enterochelin transport system permease subunit